MPGQRPGVELGRARRRGSARARRRASAGSGPPGSFALVAATQPTASSTRCGRRRKLGDADADRVGPVAGQPADSGAPGSGGRACTGRAGARARSRSAGRELRDALEQRLDARGEERGRLLAAPALERVERGDRRPRVGERARARRRCRSAAARAARPERVDRALERRPSCLHDSLAPGEVARDVDAVRSPAARAAPATSRGLVLVHLEHEPAARARARGLAASALGLALVDERDARLPVAHLRLERVELGRRRRTAGSRRRGRTGPSSAGEQVALDEARPRGRAGSAFSRASASASGETSVAVTRASGQLLRERERDRAAAGADVDDARRVDAVEQREAPLDDDLGLRARHERARVGLAASAGGSPSRRARRRAARAAPRRSTSSRAAARSASVSGRSCCV